MEESTNKIAVGRSASMLVDPLIAVPGSQTGSSLFIINLCASIAPVQVAGKTIPGFETYKLYQVARVEDGRTRHRLRLGFFTSESDAENVLVAVRDNYPTAFVTSLSDDDRRFARGYLPDTETTASWKRPTLVQKPAAPPPAPVQTAAPAPKEPAKAAAPVAKPIAPPASPAATIPAAKPAPTAPKAAAPAAPKAAVDAAPVKPQVTAKAPVAADKAPASVEADEIELSWDPPALQAPAKAVTAPATQTVAPAFKTDGVIKARPAEAPAKAAKPAVEARAAEPPKPTAPAKASAPPIELTLEKEPSVTPKVEPAAGAQPAKPFHVGKGADIPATAFSLESTGVHAAAGSAAPKAAGANPAASAPAGNKTPASPAKPASAAVSAPQAKPAAPAGSPAARGPELDTTQTIRALTSDEMNDEEKWFSIQLVVSEQPVNLDAMPHLDIFEAYSVYSVANAGSGKIVYSLRLGFFREEVSANAVGGYLKTFFPSPSVIRISTAEQLRFKDAPAPKATATAKADAKVIELNQARDRKPTVPTVTMEVAPAADRSPTGTFKTSATGTYKVNASGVHKALKPAAKNSPPATKRSAPLSKTSATGRHKALQPSRSLQEQLLDEARDVQLSASAIRKLPKNDSLLSRLVGKLTK
ncbi:MAG TPA: hypothetical protein VIT67_03035 [Povalibacter sp.]